MGAPLVATIGTETFRHYFFSFGPSHSVAFFEYLDHDTKMIAKPAGVFDERAGQFDHLSLDLPDRQHCSPCAIACARPGPRSPRSSITGSCSRSTSPIPNGIALEASFWADDPTASQPDYADDRYFRDPDPVPALAELREGGLRTVPTTKLVDAPVAV